MTDLEKEFHVAMLEVCIAARKLVNEGCHVTIDVSQHHPEQFTAAAPVVQGEVVLPHATVH